MVFGNLRISQKQFGRMVILDWVAKAALLTPGLAADLSGVEFVLSVAFGIGLALAYAWLVGRVARRMEGGFAAYAKERLGEMCTRIFMVICLCYAFLNTVLLLRLFGELAVTFILPEASREILMAAVALGGIYIVSGGLEVRARVSEVMFPLALYPLLLLLICAAFSVNPDYLAPGRDGASAEAARFAFQAITDTGIYGGSAIRVAVQGLRVFILFGGMGMFLFLAPSVEHKEKVGKTLMRGAAVTGAAALVLILAAIGAFGEAGMRAYGWPAITLMSSAKIPGGFLQRWDVIFTALLLGTFFAAVGAGIFYMRMLASSLMRRKRPVPGGVMALLAWAAALWCGSYGTAARVYTVISGYICIPLMILFIMMLAIVELADQRREKRRRLYEKGDGGAGAVGGVSGRMRRTRA